MKIGITFSAIVILIGLFCFTSWIMNASKLINSDFEAPYKSEIIRTIGLFIPPVGIVTGYMDIGDEE